MKQKKYYKTWKFWITALLALSASSIITSLTLTSCVANDNVDESDIIISNQTEDQEISVDDNKSLTLSVEATSNKGENLSYQWYVNKSSDDSNAWEKIVGATQKTYTIPASELQNTTNATTWKYKAEIYHNSDTNKKVESKPILVKIKPPTGGGSVPDKPTKPPIDNTPSEPTPPENNPEPVPPIQPPKPDVPNPEPVPPTPSPTPPNSNPDNPPIIQSPEHIDNQGIGARLPLDSLGINTTKYEQEKWIGDNSLSIAVEAIPNYNKITQSVDEFKKTCNNSSIKRMLDSMVGAITGAVNAGYSYNQFGTGWILDYYKDNSSNLIDYYIASNMHVLNSYFEFFFESNGYTDYGYEVPVQVGVRIPFNTYTVSNLNVYISQPTYNTSSYKDNLKTYADQFNNQWYKTNVDINNWNDNLIPIGAYSQETNNNFATSTAFDMELTWQYTSNPNYKQTLYFESNSNGGYLTKNPATGNSSFQLNADDFSVFKISLDDKAFDNKISNNSYSSMFRNMKELFNITNYQDATKSSSYIKKLNKLLELTQDSKSYMRSQIDDLFMFEDMNKITKLETQISIGGYPLLSEGNKKDSKSYTTFNTNTLTGNNIINYPVDKYPSRDKMGINQYTYKGNLYKIKWRGDTNYVLKNVNLLAGSSGSVGIDQNYKMTCINWGRYIQVEYFQGTKYILDSSTSTGLYSPRNKNTLVWRWVEYSKKHNNNSKLAQLFQQLEKKNYFNS